VGTEVPSGSEVARGPLHDSNFRSSACTFVVGSIDNFERRQVRSLPSTSVTGVRPDWITFRELEPDIHDSGSKSQALPNILPLQASLTHYPIYFLSQELLDSSYLLGRPITLITEVLPALRSLSPCGSSCRVSERSSLSAACPPPK
jgi:hypothetical protein